MKKMRIETSLVGKEDSFKMMAVAQAIKKPILLIGEPGVAKTKTLLDYALAHAEGNATKALNETFILETDESTRSPEIKGRPDIKSIVESNKYDVITPIADAKFVLINEIDKANAGLRNSMLSVMNERMIFNGHKKVFTPWDIFCASCNEIPSDEVKSPFWDRFVLKHQVKRITKGQMASYFKNNGKKHYHDLILPTSEEVKNIANGLNQGKLKSFINVGYHHMSDRTLSYVPDLAAAFSIVYQLDVNQALVKTAAVLGGDKLAADLAQTMEPKEIQRMREYIDVIKSLNDYDEIVKLVADIKNNARQAASKKEVTRQDLEALADSLNEALNDNAAWNAGLSAPEDADDSDDWDEAVDYGQPAVDTPVTADGTSTPTKIDVDSLPF